MIEVKEKTEGDLGVLAKDKLPSLVEIQRALERHFNKQRNKQKKKKG